MGRWKMQTGHCATALRFACDVPLAMACGASEAWRTAQGPPLVTAPPPGYDVFGAHALRR
ncbi:MAG: hypothetical protein EPN70_11365 [Paraburkholderia sp.]|nr:MAG: hypothetical protein EPN70_11365 [Paraburkholderia sp.]